MAPAFSLVWKWGARGSSWLPKTLACPPPCPPLFCPQSVDFVILMQFSAILFKLPPSHKSIPDGKPSVHRRNLICRIQWWCSRFRLHMLQWSKFGPKNQNCQFKLKFDTYTKLNMQNSVVLFTFSVFDSKYHFRSYLIQIKRETISFGLNFGTIRFKYAEFNSCSLFSNFDQVYSFGGNWSKQSELSV